MFCKNCGKQLDDAVKFCDNCGTSMADISKDKKESPTGVSHHTTPKCTYCANIGDWKIGPLFRPMDYVIGIALLIFGFVPGLIYMGVVGLIRSNKDNREKICTKCGAKNMFTNMY